MSRNYEGLNYKKIATSKLIYLLIYGDPRYCDGIMEVLNKRLTEKYGLDDPNRRLLIHDETRKINDRGQNLDNYAFNNNLSLEQLLKLFYDYSKLITPSTKVEDNFNSFTISEIARYWDLFNSMEKLYTYRKSKLQIDISLNLFKKFFTSNENKNAALDLSIYYSDSQLRNEQELINYFLLLNRFMSDKFKILLNYDENKELYTSSIMDEYFLTLLEGKPVQVDKTLKLYKDFYYDAYKADVELIKQSNKVFGFSFTK